MYEAPHTALVRWGRRAILSLLLIGTIFVGLLPIQSPSPVPSDAPPDKFSSSRALTKLRSIAQEPHPAGSAAHQAVRDYLLSELITLGLQPEIHKSSVQIHEENNNTNRAVELENIVARIPGTENSKAIMVAAHYDSVARGPGAADDGSGIAAMLETLRALKNSAPLKNDLIILMTDGEEMGMLGAEAFMREHPWAKDVGLVLNFEARGNKGPSFMFETSDQNGWLIKEFIKAAPQPIAYSLVYNVYKLMPNDTDLTVFRLGGLNGLNFAFGMGVNAYHQPIDTADNLDPSSLQHQGEYMLSLTRHFGQLDLRQITEENQIYFNLFGHKMVSYPESWAIWLAGFGSALYIAAVGYGIIRKRLSVRGTLGGFLVTLLSLLVVYGLVTLIWGIFVFGISGGQLITSRLTPEVSLYYFVGLLLFMLLIVIPLIRWLSGYIRTNNLWAGTLLLWTILSVMTALYLPGGSYLFLWPMMFSIIGLTLSLAMKEGSWTWFSLGFSLPGFLLMTPICYIVYILVTLQVAPAVMVLPAIALTLIYPLISRPSKKILLKHAKEHHSTSAHSGRH
ncbi:M20/M25/M40 family metallo-hydrolase [Paenibacillus zeisoli]|uniref:Vacuolar membrane protease n=1 Tax=Paenibacillus zeisoli TaxID=2496267 RepID=A0A433XNC1_9BACL|nr:M20/M25/M40 family metallo-hydrolase [Paenibacillus zeisoli]RUT35560.1 M20/M25/M40 family metallo-hydrolase [Paenibacillus zeisoli]